MNFARKIFRKKKTSFSEVQEKYRNIPGEKGARLRRKHYSPFFLRIGKNVHIEEGCNFFHPERIVIEDEARINIEALIYGSGGVRIGRNVRIGPRIFIHSANHDISNIETAYFERGYEENAITIGDLSLLSANVSVLPGANIGAGTFIACGAVVTKGDYEEGSKLLGVPALNKNTEQDVITENWEPSIVILVNNTYWYGIAEHLISSLGLPQVMIVSYPDNIPESVSNVLLMGFEDWEPRLDIDVPVWKFKEGYEEKNNQISLPNSIVFKTTPIKDLNSEGNNNEQLEQAAFWVINRLIKHTSPLSHKEFREWLVALKLFYKYEMVTDEVFELIIYNLNRRKPNSIRETINSEKFRGEPNKWINKLFLKSELLEEPIKVRIKKRIKRVENNFSVFDALIYPEKVVWKILNDEVVDFKFDELISKLFKIPTGLRLSCFSIVCFLKNDEKNKGLIEGVLNSSSWFKKNISLPLSISNGNAFCYSPLILVRLFFKVSRCGISNLKEVHKIKLNYKFDKSLIWLGFEKGKFIDKKNKFISKSIIENWINIHSASLPLNHQFLINDKNYKIHSFDLEEQWVKFFVMLQKECEQPLIRIKPWPTGYKAAISLRYDVDRPVSADTIEQLVDFQRTEINAPCASWYYFPKHEYKKKQTPQLLKNWQEVGLHIEHENEVDCNTGVTHHSSPTSNYWRGDETNNRLANFNCSYCEFLSSLHTYPRPILQDKDFNYIKNNTWTVPIHFPLESSVLDDNLDYFDELLTYFRDAIKKSGHVIIGSHPDINISIIKKLFKREKFEDIWFVPVEQAVQRCKDVMSYGNINVCVRAEDLMISSKKHVSDLCLEIWNDVDGKPEIISMQILANKYRKLSFTKKGKIN